MAPEGGAAPKGWILRLRRSAPVSLVLLLFMSLVAPAAASSDLFARDATTRHPHRSTRLRLAPSFGAQSLQGTSATTATQVGDKKIWVAVDFVDGSLYPKVYRLRARSEHGEIWTAIADDATSKGLAFPSGDCRNDSGRLNPTSKQLQYLLREFENNIYPKETRAFSVPPKRGGSRAILDDVLRRRGVRVPRDYYEGPGLRTVILVDNIRDENFYDTDNVNTFPPTAGFYDRFLSNAVDRHVMTIDSFNWAGNTTATPAESPGTDPCTSFSSTPYNYEATFAHEFQHLLQSYADPSSEEIWMDEGLAMWAEVLTGYSDPAAPISSPRASSYVHCLLGTLEQPSEFNPRPEEHCGPENSLTWWDDQQDDPVEIIADYGAAHTYMEMLVDRHGRDAMTFLHRADQNGLDAVDRMLANQSATGNALDTIHDWLMVLAIDRLLDAGATLNGSTKDYEVSTLNSMIDWLNDDAYMTPGAPPNGGDFVLARNSSAQYVGAGAIDSIAFDGGDSFPPRAVEWRSDSSQSPGDPALYSGSGDNLDRSIVKEVAVPATGATLTFETLYQMDRQYDYGFVQVSTDGGATWTSLANAHTTDRTKTGPPISSHLPGFTGRSGSESTPQWVNESFNLSAYAGRTVLLAFRYMTDAAVTRPGWWIDDVRVGGALVSDGTDTGTWKTITQIKPDDVFGFTVQLVAWTNDGTNVFVGELPLDATHKGSLSGAALDTVIGTTAENVGVIVTYDEPTESIKQYAPYVLTVNGVTQPGGA